MSTPALPEISQEDLKDPTLGKLNRNFLRVWSKVIEVFGGSGNVNFQSTVIAPDLQIPSQSQPPTNKDSVITLRSGLALFGPTNQRQSLVSGAFQKSSTSVATSQPLGVVGGGFSGTITGTFSVDGSPKTKLIVVGGAIVDVQ